MCIYIYIYIYMHTSYVYIPDPAARRICIHIVGARPYYLPLPPSPSSIARSQPPRSPP